MDRNRFTRSSAGWQAGGRGGGGGGGQPAAGGRSSRSRAHRRHAEDRRLLPALLGRAHRLAVPRDPEARHRVPVEHRAVRRPRLERHRPRSRQRRRRRASCRSSASARACCWCRANQSFRSSSANPLERKSVEDSFAKSILWGFTVAGESQRPRAGRRHRLLPARRHGAGSSLRPGTYRVDRTRSAFYLPRTESFPKNTEIDMTLTFTNDAAGGRGGGGGGPTQGPAPIRPTAAAARRRRRRTRRRTVLRHGRQRHADRRSGDAARALRRSSSCPTATTSRASTIRAPATAASATSTTARRSASRWSDALPPPPSPREEGSERGDQRAGEADSVLGRSGRAGRREEGAGRRRELVEPGVRSRRLPQRASRSTCCPTAPTRWTSATT